MKRLLITLALLAALLALLAAPPLAGAGVPQPALVTTFAAGDTGGLYGSFLRGMAMDSNGDLIAGLTVWGATGNQGQVWAVAPDGTKTSPPVKLELSPYGAFMSLAVDSSDKVYVAVYDIIDGSGIFRVDGDQLTRVATFPAGMWPNGIAFYKSRLYVSDAAQGGIWRISVDDGVASPTQPWVMSSLLPPGKPMGIGVTGVAFKGDTLHAAVHDSGSIVRVPVKKDGSPGTPSLVCKQKELKTADGIAFDRLGRLWVAVNGTKNYPGALYRVGLNGTVTLVTDDPAWLAYPTQPVFGVDAQAGTLFLANGDYFGHSAPTIISLPVGVAGLPL